VGISTATDRHFALRQLVLDAPRSDLERVEGTSSVGLVESFKVVHQFHFTSTSLAGICQVKFRIPRVSPRQMAGHVGLTKVEQLTRLEDGSYLAYYEGRPTAGWAKLAATSGAHLVPPFELTPKSWRITVVGTTPHLRRFLRAVGRARIHYRVRSLGKAHFRPESPLGALTAKQREALVTAYRTGYYDVPRRADSSQVARALGRGKSSTVEHLRKAEKRLLDQIL
jgi:predicted DNA binding protein